MGRRFRKEGGSNFRAKGAAETHCGNAHARSGITAPEPAEEAAAEEANPPSRSFQMLVDFLTRNAAAMLGGMADPTPGKRFSISRARAK